MRVLLCILGVSFLTGCGGYCENNAIRLTEAGEYHAAIEVYDKILSKDPDNIYALLNRGVNKSNTNKKQGAIEDYSQVIALNQKNTLAWVNRAKVKYELQDYIGSIKDLNEAARHSRKVKITIYNDVLRSENDYEVDYIEVIYERGWSCLKADSIQQAHKDFNLCITDNYRLKESYYGRGMANLGIESIESAMQDFQKVIQLGRTDSKFVLHAKEIVCELQNK